MADYRVAELARAAGTTVRNVRVYQERGLLPPPRLVGRTGWYDDTHLARLRLVTRLLDRGFTLANIRELLTTWERGLDLGSVLGIEQALVLPWNDEETKTVTMAQLRRVFGAGFTPEQAARLVAVGLLERAGRGYRVPSPGLLSVAGELVALGLSPQDVVGLAETMAEQLAVVARAFVVTAAVALRPPGASEADAAADVARLAAVSPRLRPLAAMAVSRGFAVTMERESMRLLRDRIERPRRVAAAGPATAASRRRHGTPPGR